MGMPTRIPINTHTNAGDGLFVADWALRPFNLAYVVEVPTGVTVSYTMQYSLDDPNESAPTVGNTPGTAVAPFPFWVADPTNGSAQATTQGGFYTFPIWQLRVNVSALSGGVATIFLRVLQAMPF